MDRLLAGARHAGHGEAGRGIDQIPERLAEGAVVIDDQDRHVARRLAGGGERLAVRCGTSARGHGLAHLISRTFR
jgi:hypothetical protein